MSTEMPENPQQPSADQPIPPPEMQPASPPPPAAAGPSADERLWGMLACLGGIFGLLPPLIIWLVQKDKMPFVDDQGKEALNFEISVCIAWFGLIVVGAVLGTILAIIHLGILLSLLWLLYPALWIYNLVMSIVAGLKANEGIAYRYPISLRLVK
jgi:uncharacterized Tic20 family protein